MHPCLEPGCPTLTTSRRCPEHKRAAEKARGTRQQRGYDNSHDQLRAKLLATVDGRPCPRCGEPMRHWQPLHLDHTDDRTGYLGLSHAGCNLSAAGEAAHA